jgi:hypothetical protein
MRIVIISDLHANAEALAAVVLRTGAVRDSADECTRLLSGGCLWCNFRLLRSTFS